MKSYDSILKYLVSPYLSFCDRFFPLNPEEKDTTVEFRSRSLILVFFHVSIVLVLHTINSLITVGFWAFLKGFFLVDLCLLATLFLIRSLKKPERFAGPYMCVFMLGVALVVVFSGRTPVTGLGSWWPLWIFWTILIAGAWYGYVITFVAAVSAAIFLFGPFLGTPHNFDFGLTAEGWARFLLVDITFVSLVGHMVSILFQHFLKTTHQKWLQSRNHADLEIRFRMLSRFARHIYETLSPGIQALQSHCSGILEVANLPNESSDRLADLKEAKQEIDRLAMINQRMLAFTNAIRADNIDSIEVQHLIINILSMKETWARVSQIEIVQDPPSQSRIPAAEASVVQLFLASVFLTAHEDERLQVKQLRVLDASDNILFYLDGVSYPTQKLVLAELCHDCHRLLEGLRKRSDCQLQRDQEAFVVQIRVAKAS